MSGDEDRVRVWRVDDRKKVATMTAKLVQCLAVSSDGMWIAAGTTWSGFIVRSTKTYEKVLTLEEGTVITGLDFSPDSTRLVTASDNRTAAVWDITTRDRLLLLRHKDDVIAAKYAPQGDRIATATRHSVRFYDSNEGHLLAEAQVKVTSRCHSCLLWSDKYLFVVSNNKIKQIDPSNGSVVSKWPVPHSNSSSCIALPQHGQYIACSTDRTVTLWDTSTRIQLGSIEYPQDVRSIALSPDARTLATGDENGVISSKRLSLLRVSRNGSSQIMAYLKKYFTSSSGTNHSY